MMSTLHYTIMFRWIFTLQAHNLQVDMSSLWHIILIQSQTVFALAPECYEISEEVANTSFIVWFDQGSNPLSTTVDASTLTIAPLCFHLRRKSINVAWNNNKLHLYIFI
jgi:hypothetical protein